MLFAEKILWLVLSALLYLQEKKKTFLSELWVDFNPLDEDHCLIYHKWHSKAFTHSHSLSHTLSLSLTFLLISVCL